MAYEMIVGLLVSDNETYARYRAEMSPLLEQAGGRFRFDFDIARTLKSEASSEINRIFVLHFPDRAAKDRFFSDSAYRQIRARLFEPSVQAASILAEYDTGSFPSL